MDNNPWAEFVPCSRLKTKRRKRRLQKTDADKRLIQNYKKLEKLSTQIRNLGYQELVHPIQRGWKRTFILRPDLEKNKDAPFFKTLLEKINSVQYSHRRDFKTKLRRKGKKVYIEVSQTLAHVCDWNSSNLNFTEKEKSYFKAEWVISNNKSNKFLIYVFNEPWRFVLKVEPNMISRVKIIDPLLLQAEAEIENYLVRRNLYPILNNLNGIRNSYKYHWGSKEKDKYQSLKRFHNAEMNENKNKQHKTNQ